MTNNNLSIGLVVVAIVAIIGLFSPFGSAVRNTLGGVTNYDEVDATAIKIGGANGSRIGPVIATTCSLLADDSIAATSTGPVDCAVIGVVAGDRVFATLAASTTLASQYVIKSSTASSTSGFVTLDLVNLTGTSATPSATNGFGSSTIIYVMHPVSTVPGL